MNSSKTIRFFSVAHVPWAIERYALHHDNRMEYMHNGRIQPIYLILIRFFFAIHANGLCFYCVFSPNLWINFLHFRTMDIGSFIRGVFHCETYSTSLKTIVKKIQWNLCSRPTANSERMIRIPISILTRNWLAFLWLMKRKIVLIFY